jgi:hypothetical protein
MNNIASKPEYKTITEENFPRGKKLGDDEKRILCLVLLSAHFAHFTAITYKHRPKICNRRAPLIFTQVQLEVARDGVKLQVFDQSEYRSYAVTLRVAVLEEASNQHLQISGSARV